MRFIWHRQRAYTSLGVLDRYHAACSHLGIAPDVIGVDAPGWGPAAADALLADLRERGVTAAVVLGDPEATLIEAQAAFPRGRQDPRGSGAGVLLTTRSPSWRRCR